LTFDIIVECDGGVLPQHELEDVIVKFFGVKEIIQSTVLAYIRTKVLTYWLLYGTYIQLIFYFNAHPRMATLYQTMVKCFQDMAHFLFLFSVLFFFLSYMAYFQFGDLLPGHATFLKSSISQFRMIFGEFIYDEEADALTSSQYLLYWAYSGTFMIVAFFILLNFFLAIVVDNFMLVKEDVKEFNAENNIWVDVWDIAESYWKYRKYKWPDRLTVINFLNARGDEGPEKSDKSGVLKVMSDFVNGPPREFCEDSVKADEFLSSVALKSCILRVICESTFLVNVIEFNVVCSPSLGMLSSLKTPQLMSLPLKKSRSIP